MAKVKGPLMSLAASGTFRGVMEFRTGNGETTVAGTRSYTAPRSPAQAAQSARFKTATEAWGALTETQRSPWRVSASAKGMTGYRLYVSEYLIQNITPPGQPQLPP